MHFSFTVYRLLALHGIKDVDIIHFFVTVYFKIQKKGLQSHQTHVERNTELYLVLAQQKGRTRRRSGLCDVEGNVQWRPTDHNRSGH